MYTKENKNGRLLNFILGIIAIIIIIFVIIWIINKGHTTSRNTKMFNNNLNNMQETANEYFNRNLPENVGESYKVSLKEMYALGLSDKLYYGNDACDADESYISVTKTSDNEYKVTSVLKCVDKTDSKINTIKVNDGKSNTNTNTNTNTVVDNTTTNTNTNTNKNTSSNTGCPSKPNCGGTIGVSCQVIVDDNCKTVFEYEYVKKTYGCPEGYAVTSDGRCSKTTTDKVEPNKDSSTTTTNAKKTSDTYVKQYTPVIIEAGSDTLYCKDGDLKNGLCYKYTNKTSDVTYSCPEGYDKTGTGANTKCTKTTTVKADKKTTRTYSCPANYTQAGTGSNTKCYKTETTKYTLGYTPWGNPDKVYDLDHKIAVYEKELEKLIQTGSTCKTLFGTTSCIYSYEHYSRGYTYNCPADYTQSGSGVNTKCSKTVYTGYNTTTTTTYNCPDNYTKTGTGDNTKCTLTETAKATSTTTYSCPDGYKDNGTKCYKTSTPSTYSTGATYSCPTNYIVEGTGANTKCYKNVKVAGEYYCENANATLTSDHKCVVKNPTVTTCPTDYTLSNGMCEKTTTEYVPMVVSGSKYIYSSLTAIEGYTRTGYYKYTYSCEKSSK